MQLCKYLVLNPQRFSGAEIPIESICKLPTAYLDHTLTVHIFIFTSREMLSSIILIPSLENSLTGRSKGSTMILGYHESKYMGRKTPLYNIEFKFILVHYIREKL